MIYNIPNLKDCPQVLPHELNGMINPVCWQEIFSLRNISVEATNQACCLEIIGCLLITPLVFCCHPCIQSCFASSKLEHSCRRLNSLYFNGASVILPMPGTDGITINLMMIQSIGVVHAPAYVVPQQVNNQFVASAVPQQVNPSYPKADYSSDGMAPPQVQVMAQPQVAHRIERMRVVIPQGSYAGSTIAVQSPTGSLIQVVIPQGKNPGDEVIVEYTV